MSSPVADCPVADCPEAYLFGVGMRMRFVECSVLGGPLL